MQICILKDREMKDDEKTKKPAAGHLFKGDTVFDIVENDVLMHFLLLNLKHKNRDNINSLLRNKQVIVNGKAISQFDHPLKPGYKLVIKWAQAAQRELYRNLNIVFEDDYLIVIDKQSGLLSISNGSDHDTAYNILSKHVKLIDSANRIFIVHRLDRDTSGLMMFSKSEEIQSIMQREWHSNVSERTYIAVVEGSIENPEGTIRSYLFEGTGYIMYSSQDPSKGELSITHFKTLKVKDNYSLVECSLETGKKNQIRVHMQSIGHSVAGDEKYGARSNPLGRLGLHASVLEFKHPVTGKTSRFESKIPAKFSRMF
jgi:23S rRNA pseudouridine1911/1915/1917 synthase